MLEKEFAEIYDAFKQNFYASICSEDLTLMEALSLDVIRTLHEPTVAEFARFMGVSAPNASYRVNRLIEEGYLTRRQSSQDRRIYTLQVREDWHPFARNEAVIERALAAANERFSKEELLLLCQLLHLIKEEIENDSDHH